MSKTYKAGTLLFSEGDPADYVIRVEAGSVDILRDLGEETILLGTIKAGEFLGEMGVIEGLPRSATARAATNITVEELAPLAFFERVSNDPKTSLVLIRRLSARLRDASDRLVGAVTGDRKLATKVFAQTAGEAAGPDRHGIEITAASPTLEAQIGAAPHAVTELPYIVGRWPSADEPGPIVPLDLAIDDPPPHRMSRAHFIVIEEYGKPVVRDLASELGTMVNGRAIGRDFPLDVALLEHGPNEVVAGGADSPYRFVIAVS